jgi:hypothetical protein
MEPRCDRGQKPEDDEDWYLGTKASETLLFLLFTQLNIGMVVFFFGSVVQKTFYSPVFFLMRLLCFNSVMILSDHHYRSRTHVGVVDFLLATVQPQKVCLPYPPLLPRATC